MSRYIVHKAGQVWAQILGHSSTPVHKMDRMLSGHHFVMTFTVPEELPDFTRTNLSICYAALYSASSVAMKKLFLDPKHVGSDLPCFFGVPHTWDRQFQYHPHIHYVVPGGAISTEDGKWRRSGEQFFLPVKALSIIFRESSASGWRRRDYRRNP